MLPQLPEQDCQSAVADVQVFDKIHSVPEDKDKSLETNDERDIAPSSTRALDALIRIDTGNQKISPNRSFRRLRARQDALL